MITQTNIGAGLIQFDCSCDHCSESETVEANSFNEAWDTLKELGWRFTAKKEHVCPSCVEDWVTEQRAVQ